MKIEAIHHVSLGVTDLERSRQFYREILGLEEITRPPFNFPGAWFAAGASQQVHLIVHPNSTFRTGKGLDTRDGHFAVRVPSYGQAVEYLRSKGYREDGGGGEFHTMRLQPQATAGFPQIYILDPDRNVIEINAAVLD
jgi:catechol 2,3-dioxygenase-like lactoylglutathione lyase family enzyme